MKNQAIGMEPVCFFLVLFCSGRVGFSVLAIRIHLLKVKF